MLKKCLVIFCIILSLVFLFGCVGSDANADKNTTGKNAINNEEKPDEEKPDDEKTDDEEPDEEEAISNFDNPLDAKKIVIDTFGEDDKVFDFKVKETEKFFNTFDEMYGFTDERYTVSELPTGFFQSDDKTKSQIDLDLEIKDYDQRYQSIMSFSYLQGFNDDKDYLYSYNSLDLKICDDDKDEKITLTDEMKGILQAAYKDIDLSETQKRIDESIQICIDDEYDSVKLESVDKYHTVYFNNFKYEDNPIEISISLDSYNDYPVE